jgi:sugar (pentulose or hexulose) kinase
MGEAVYTGLDLGTSGCNGVLVTADGRVRARAAARSPTRRPEPGSAEQDPRDWFTAFTWVTLRLAQTVAAERWQARGLSAMLRTLVLTDGTGAAATPGGAGAPSSRPSLGTARPGHHLGRRPDGGGGHGVSRGARGRCHRYRRTGQWLDGRYLIPMALRLAAQEPERISAARYLLGAMGSGPGPRHVRPAPGARPR